MEESRTQLLPPLPPSVGLCACCWHRRTSQSWGSFSVNMDLWQEKRIDFRKTSLSSGSCHFQCDVAGVFTTLHHGEMEFPQFSAWKCPFVMHICHCCHRIAHGKQAGRLKPECWTERGGAAQSHKQTWSTASPLLLPASSWEQICDTSRARL